mgnify:FL=1
MTKTESGKKYALIAAICYAVYAIYNIIDVIIYVSNYEYATITVFKILFWIRMLGMAVALFVKNQKIVIAAAGVNALLGAYYTVTYFSLWNLCDFLAYASVVVFVILTLKGNDVVKKIWFVPAAVLLLGCVIDWIEFLSATWIWKSMLVSIVEIVALLFAGMWVKEIVAPAEASPVNEYATFNPQSVNSTPASSSAIGGADKLKMYKDLLESGTITQEEFDAKKKQILGL